MLHLFEPFIPIVNVFWSIRLFVLSFLPERTQTVINLIHDALTVGLFLGIGRIMPSLRSYLQINNSTKTKLHGKNVIVTGANAGIGLQIARDLASLGANVFLACRNESKANDAIQQIRKAVPHAESRLHFLRLDTSDLDSVRDLAKTWSDRGEKDRQIDVLFHNAGIASIPPNQPFSKQDFPITYATNLLGSFLLTNLLLPYLSPTARIIFTSSAGQYPANPTSTFSTTQVKGRVEVGFHVSTRGSTPTSFPESNYYGNSKFQQTLLAHLLQDKFNTETQLSSNNQDINSYRPRKTVHSFSPGFTTSEIFKRDSTKGVRDLPFVLLKSGMGLATDVSEGSATGTWLASTDDQSVVGPTAGGEFWDRMVIRKSPADLMSRTQKLRFWKRWCADADIEW